MRLPIGLSAMDGIGDDDGSDHPEQGSKVLGGRAPLLEGLTQGLSLKRCFVMAHLSRSPSSASAGEEEVSHLFQCFG